MISFVTREKRNVLILH